jgi:hypothetical protein
MYWLRSICIDYRVLANKAQSERFRLAEYWHIIGPFYSGIHETLLDFLLPLR